MPTPEEAKYTDPDILNRDIDAYFAKCVEEKKRPTKPGLALHLGYASRQTLWDMANTYKNKSLAYCVKRAHSMIEDALCQQDSSMAIFQLKAYCGASDSGDSAGDEEKSRPVLNITVRAE